MPAALLLAIASAVIWGVGSIFLKRISDVVAPTTYIVFQYLLGAVAVGAWIVASGRVGNALDAVRRGSIELVVAAILLVAGYLLFIAAVRYAGEGSIPTAAAIAIASAYPVIVAILSASLLGENLGWNHVLAVALFVGAIVVVQL